MLNSLDADICIIGSGVAGALVAHACATRGATVVLLEAGPRYNRGDRQKQLQRQMLGYDAWPVNAKRDTYVNASDFKYPLNDYRLRAVGGSTLHWSGVAQRLLESDFETQTRYGLGVDWPIAYRDLEPYYGKAERELGVAGESAVDGPARSTPFPMEPFPDSLDDTLWRQTASRMGVSVHRAAYARNNFVSYDGRPPCATYASCNICPIGAQYSADWHVMKAEQTGRCTVLAETPARRIETDAEGIVRVVRATRWDGSEVDVRAQRYVLAAHGIESARLMLMSRTGNQDKVGRYLMEHWELSGRGVSTERGAPLRVGFPIMNSFHYYDKPNRSERGAIRLVFRDHFNPHGLFNRKPGLWGAGMATFDCDTFGRWRTLEVGTEHQPNAESRVTLDATEKDLFGDPAPRLRFELSAIDHRTHADARNIMQELFSAAGLRDITIGKQFWGEAHHMGTCRMSARPEDGVVDAQLRVHGSRNLFVSGSSVFPTGGAVTPTLTIAALSLRLADQLMLELAKS